MKTMQQPLRILGMLLVLELNCHAQSVLFTNNAVPFAVQGSVEIESKSGSKVKISSGTITLQPGDTLRTDAASGVCLIIDSSASVRLESSAAVKLPESKNTPHSLELLKGKLFLNIQGDELKKRAGTEFRLKTPAALLAVKGTKFFTSSADGLDTIGVHEGRVIVFEPKSGKTVALDQGNTVQAKAGYLGTPVALDAAKYGNAIDYLLSETQQISAPWVVRKPVQGKPRRDFNFIQDGKVLQVTEITEVHKHLRWWTEAFYSDGNYPYVCSLLPDGILRWTAGVRNMKLGKGNMTLAAKDMGISSAVGDIVALRFRCRAVNMAKVEIAFHFPDFVGETGAVSHNLKITTPGTWNEVFVPVSYRSENSPKNIHLWPIQWEYVDAANVQSVVIELADLTIFVRR
jgi:hypothetical protein